MMWTTRRAQARAVHDLAVAGNGACCHGRHHHSLADQAQNDSHQHGDNVNLTPHNREATPLSRLQQYTDRSCGQQSTGIR